jgi:hypothetical protein
MNRLVKSYASEVAFWHHVAPADVLATRRGRPEVCAARADVMRRLRSDGYSLPQIGRWMRRDHTTVLHHTREIEARRIPSARRFGSRDWSPIRDCNLMELVSEGLSFEDAAKVIGVSRNAAIARFHRIRETMGAQAI